VAPSQFSEEGRYRQSTKGSEPDLSKPGPRLARHTPPGGENTQSRTGWGLMINGRVVRQGDTKEEGKPDKSCRMGVALSAADRVKSDRNESE